MNLQEKCSFKCCFCEKTTLCAVLANGCNHIEYKSFSDTTLKQLSEKDRQTEGEDFSWWVMGGYHSEYSILPRAKTGDKAWPVCDKAWQVWGLELGKLTF